MNRFISALFLFETRLYSKVKHKIMQIDFPDTHTDIMKKNYSFTDEQIYFSKRKQKKLNYLKLSRFER